MKENLLECMCFNGKQYKNSWNRYIIQTDRMITLICYMSAGPGRESKAGGTL